MRAWQVHGRGEPIDVVRCVDATLPDPRPDQLRLRVTAAGIGLPDVFMCRGMYPLTPPLPFTPGQEVSGVVVAAGDDVTTPIGTRVMAVTAFTDGHGSFADECLVSAANAFPIPEGLTDSQAAGFWIPHLTAWVGLVDRGGIRPGDRLAVLGASGGSGIAAVQLGKALGAHVTAVVGDGERARFCRQLGADATIDHRAGPIAPAIRAATDGHGADLVYDPVGGALAEASVRGLARHGRLLAVGFASGSWPNVATHVLVTTNTSLVGVFAGGYSRSDLDAIHAGLSTLVADQRLRNAVTEEVPFLELPRALQEMADRAVVGKRVLVV